jgi:hypothetical protein
MLRDLIFEPMFDLSIYSSMVDAFVNRSLSISSEVVLSSFFLLFDVILLFNDDSRHLVSKYFRLRCRKQQHNNNKACEYHGGQLYFERLEQSEVVLAQGYMTFY